jgi:hypothetical protein
MNKIVILLLIAAVAVNAKRGGSLPLISTAVNQKNYFNSMQA